MKPLGWALLLASAALFMLATVLLLKTITIMVLQLITLLACAAVGVTMMGWLIKQAWIRIGQ